MKRFDTFGAYMFDLLFATLKRGKRTANQFFIFFKVVGRVFDGMKKDAFRVRDEANVATASPVMLPVHGQDRDMPRLEGEDIESYRTRLSMKGVISEAGGIKSGILYALASLGYEQSTIEPFSYQDPERWAEFIVFLKGSKQSGVNNLAVIDWRGHRDPLRDDFRVLAVSPLRGNSLRRVASCCQHRPPVELRSPGRQHPRLRRGRVPQGGNDRSLRKILSAVRVRHV